MKKEYRKPAIMFENFSLSTNIAGDCEVKTNLSTRNDGCGYSVYGDIIFAAAIGSGCDTTSNVGAGSDGTPVYNDTLCYHVPIETKNLFNS